MIHKLKLQENKITVLLFDKYLAENEDEYDKEMEPVRIYSTSALFFFRNLCG